MTVYPRRPRWGLPIDFIDGFPALKRRAGVTSPPLGALADIEYTSAIQTIIDTQPLCFLVTTIVKINNTIRLRTFLTKDSQEARSLDEKKPVIYLGNSVFSPPPISAAK